MRNLKDSQNVDGVSSDFPFGRTRDNVSGNDGTIPYNRLFGDFITFLHKVVNWSGEAPDNTIDKETPTGGSSTLHNYQMLDGFAKFIRKVAGIEWFSRNGDIITGGAKGTEIRKDLNDVLSPALSSYNYTKTFIPDVSVSNSFDIVQFYEGFYYSCDLSNRILYKFTADGQEVANLDLNSNRMTYPRDMVVGSGFIFITDGTTTRINKISLDLVKIAETSSNLIGVRPIDIDRDYLVVSSSFGTYLHSTDLERISSVSQDAKSVAIRNDRIFILLYTDVVNVYDLSWNLLNAFDVIDTSEYIAIHNTMICVQSSDGNVYAYNEDGILISLKSSGVAAANGYYLKDSGNIGLTVTTWISTANVVFNVLPSRLFFKNNSV